MESRQRKQERQDRCRIIKYWYRVLIEKDELLKCCYEWQVGNPKCGSWTRNLRDDLYKRGLVYLWLDRDLKNVCQIIKTRSHDTKRKSKTEKTKKNSLTAYWNTTQEWRTEMYIDNIIRKKELGQHGLDWECGTEEVKEVGKVEFPLIRGKENVVTEM